jgi:hypothetical protein
MLKRTKGRFLLTLLVITGLAGTFKNSSLTKPERKFVINELKESRVEFLESIKGLTPAQLDFKPSADRWSIRECAYHIAISEKELWEMLASSLKKPASPIQSVERMPDEVILKKLADLENNKLTAPGMLQPSKSPWQSTDEAAAAFKSTRTDHLKYVKSTTEDLRDHFIDHPMGKMDGYQFIIYISGHCRRHAAQIEQIKSLPGFPK